MRQRVAIVFLGIAVLACALGAQDTGQPPANDQASARPRNYKIAVNVQSRDPRVKLMVGDLNRDAADTVERSGKNVDALIVVGTKAEAAEQARRRNADYLLIIDFAPHSSTSVGFGAGAGRERNHPEIYGSPAANAQGEMFLAWNIEPLNGNKIRLKDSRYMQKAEYPLPDGSIAPNWLADIAHEAVRSAAAAAMSKLKLKKGLDLRLEVQGIHGH